MEIIILTVLVLCLILWNIKLQYDVIKNKHWIDYIKRKQEQINSKSIKNENQISDLRHDLIKGFEIINKTLKSHTEILEIIRQST